MSESKDEALHFWVGVMLAGTAVVVMFMLDGVKVSSGVNAFMMIFLVLGIVLMVRYPLKKRPRP